MRRLLLALLALALAGLLAAGCDAAAAPGEGTAAPAAAPATSTLMTPQGAPMSELTTGAPAPATSDRLADDLERSLEDLEQSLQGQDTLEGAGLGD